MCRLLFRIPCLAAGLVTVCSLSPCAAPAQPVDLSFLQTRAERTDYIETTRYDEVTGFLEVAAAQDLRVHLTRFGYTTEGRALPLIIYGDVADASAEAVRRSGKLVVYLQGTIHAGEVCGKEALLMLVRDLASGAHSEWADSLVLLITPIYNADGNERISLYNRPRQNGPFGGMGQRPNAQGLDLNRDHMKVKSPEARALLGLLNSYDPAIVLDLHTTDGSRHAYRLTYSPPLNPDSDPDIIHYLRDVWLPDLTERVRDKYGWEYYFYGNLPFRKDSQRGWYTFDHRPRFNNNYIGLRNRIALLSEAYAYASFRDRVYASRYFIEESLQFAYAHATRIAALLAAADNKSIVGDSMAVQAGFTSNPRDAKILLGETRELVNPYTGSPYLDRIDVSIPATMPEYGTFEATESERVPSSYFVDAANEVILSYLDVHGIRYETLDKGGDELLEVFRIDSTRTADRPFQKINERRVWGRYEKEIVHLESGTLVIPMVQPLSRLAFYLLEPRSDDGLVNWGQLDEWIEVGGVYPVRRSVN